MSRREWKGARKGRTGWDYRRTEGGSMGGGWKLRRGNHLWKKWSSVSIMLAVDSWFPRTNRERGTRSRADIPYAFGIWHISKWNEQQQSSEVEVEMQQQVKEPFAHTPAHSSPEKDTVRTPGRLLPGTLVLTHVDRVWRITLRSNELELWGLAAPCRSYVSYRFSEETRFITLPPQSEEYE